MTDFNYIPARQDAINLRLENWGRWVRVKPKAWSTQPMFRMYQSKARHWELSPHIHVEVNTLDGSEIERAVSALPDKHRTAIRWFYVFSFIHFKIMQRTLGVTSDGLAALVQDSRDMLKNRLKESLTSDKY